MLAVKFVIMITKSYILNCNYNTYHFSNGITCLVHTLVLCYHLNLCFLTTSQLWNYFCFMLFSSMNCNINFMAMFSNKDNMKKLQILFKFEKLRIVFSCFFLLQINNNNKCYVSILWFILLLLKIDPN